MMKFRIDHPMADRPVSIWRWLAWKAAYAVYGLGYKLEGFALADFEDDEIPF